MKAKRNILFLFLLTLTLCCQAKREPSWMRELPKPGNETYIYVRESGEGATINDALAQAMVRVFQSTANRLGQPFDSQKVKNALLSGTDYKIISQQYNIPVNRVGVYSTQIREGTYWVYVLCQVASMGNVTPVWDKVGMNSQTATWVALAKSTILPGWGQMGKDHFAEGLVTLVGECALVGGGIVCYNVAMWRRSSWALCALRESVSMLLPRQAANIPPCKPCRMFRGDWLALCTSSISSVPIPPSPKPTST